MLKIFGELYEVKSISHIAKRTKVDILVGVWLVGGIRCLVQKSFFQLAMKYQILFLIKLVLPALQ